MKRIIESLPSKQSAKITKFINELEDEVIRLSRPTKAELHQEAEGIIEITPLVETKHLTDNWQFDKDDLELNVCKHLKKLDVEVGERPDMRKIYCIGDVHWMETTYPNLYKKQMTSAYIRMGAMKSYKNSARYQDVLRRQNQKENGIEFNFNS